MEGTTVDGLSFHVGPPLHSESTSLGLRAMCLASTVLVLVPTPQPHLRCRGGHVHTGLPKKRDRAIKWPLMESPLFFLTGDVRATVAIVVMVVLGGGVAFLPGDARR